MKIEKAMIEQELEQLTSFALPYVADLFEKLKKEKNDKKFVEEIFHGFYDKNKCEDIKISKKREENYKKNFIKALAIANDVNKNYKFMKGKWAFIGGVAVFAYIAEKLGISEALRKKGCTDIDIIIDNSLVSPSMLKSIYDIHVGVLYPCEKFYFYDVNLEKIKTMKFYNIDFPVIGLDDLIKLKKQAIEDKNCVRKKKHERDINLLKSLSDS